MRARFPGDICGEQAKPLSGNDSLNIKAIVPGARVSNEKPAGLGEGENQWEGGSKSDDRDVRVEG